MPDIIVIGTSLGGLSALKRLLAEVPENIPASILIVQHISSDSPQLLPAILDRAGPMPVSAASDGQRLQHGQVLVAPPGMHLTLDSAGVRLSRGPHENRARPSIDVLFRSAAVAFGPRVVGVLLTGLLNDGVAGLVAIKRCGGLVVIQDPADADYPDMPQNAVDAMAPDHLAALKEMPILLDRLARLPATAPVPIPEGLQFEVRMAQSEKAGLRTPDGIGKPSPFACPECSGVLWQLNDDVVPRFRCRVGHAYTAEFLKQEQSEKLEAALWAATRSLEEHAHLLQRLQDDFEGSGRHRINSNYAERRQTMVEHAQTLRELLMTMSSTTAVHEAPITLSH